MQAPQLKQYQQFTRSGGMTLIELMVTLVLAVLMLAVGMPGFVELRKNQTQGAVINQHYALMSYARSLAITDATTVTLCGSTNSRTCTDTANLAKGAILLAEDDDGENVLVRVIDPVSDEDFKIALEGFPLATSLVFSDVGEVVGLAGTASVTFCDSRGEKEASALVVNPLGMVRVASDDDGDDLVNIHTSNNISCSG